MEVSLTSSNLESNHFPPPTERAIKIAGRGKRGSKNLPLELIHLISEDIQNNSVDEAQIGALVGALFSKGISLEEMHIINSLGSGEEKTQIILNYFNKNNLGSEIFLVKKILDGEYLSRQESHDLGQFIFSQSVGDGIKGLVASYLRVRYESLGELLGLYDSMLANCSDGYKLSESIATKSILIGEPFDGVNRSYLITPIISHFLNELGYLPINLTGESSGPKFGCNLDDLSKELGFDFLKNSQEIHGGQHPKCGHYINQNDLAPNVGAWVALRKRILKRPFLAILEKYLNPMGCEIFLSSCFHEPYVEKMVTLAEQLKFKKIIIIYKGIEGGIALDPAKEGQLVCSSINDKGSYTRKSFEFPKTDIILKDFYHGKMASDILLHKNALFIDEYLKTGSSGNIAFDHIVKHTQNCLTRAFSWLNK